MHKLCAFSLVATAIGALACSSAPSLAQTPGEGTHVMTLRLADGTTERIRYQGDQPPQVSVADTRIPFAGYDQLFDESSDLNATFVDMERMSAALDRDAAAMLSEARDLSALGPNAGGLAQIDLDRLPPGARGYSVISTLTANGVCTKTTRYAAEGAGRPPRILTSSSGNCGAATDQAAPLASSRPIPISHRPHLIEASVKSSGRAKGALIRTASRY